MKISINIIHNKINELREALIYFLPKKIDEINNSINEINEPFNFNNYIIIDDNKIYCHIYCLKESLFIDDVEFINIISILKKCDNKTIIIKTEQDEFLDIFNNIDGIKNIPNDVRKLSTLEYSYGFTIIINSDEISAVNGRYEYFFNKYKKFEGNSFIRMLKLKKLL